MKIRYTLSILLLLMSVGAWSQRHEVRRNGRVLAHTLNFDPTRETEEMPPMLREMLRAYRTGTRYGERLRGKRVEPLLHSRRHQEEPYNRHCPYYTFDNGEVSSTRCVTGCVATCLEQVVSYYRYPSELQDTLHGWSTDHYTIDDVMPGTKIDWDNILDDYSEGYTEEQAEAIAALSLYCGMAVRMNYGVESSSANLGRAVDGLYDALGYKTIAITSRWLYSTDTWNRMLRRELEAGRPICYTGHNMSLGGHAFNIDGVDEEGYYHLNWGYDGSYDGWFDLDYLDPFEQMGSETEMGRASGLFCNQTALFMHPEDFVIDIYDTIPQRDAYYGVKVNKVRWNRTIDDQNYVVATCELENTTEDTLYYTFEALTYAPTDTAIFEQADYVGITSVVILPKEKKDWNVYCHFTERGERTLALSSDDSTFIYEAPVTVAKGVESKLKFGDVDYKLEKRGDDLVARLEMDVTNEATGGCAGDLLTYCLLKSGETDDQRHFAVLNLPAGSREREVVAFNQLEDGAEYTFMVRWPWRVSKEYTFTVDAKEAVDGIVSLESGKEGSAGKTYDLSGRETTGTLNKGLYIRNGRKFIIP